MKAEKIIESLEIAEKLIESAKESVKKRKEKGESWGTPGKDSNSNLKDKIRIARGLLQDASNGLNWRSFDKEGE